MTNKITFKTNGNETDVYTPYSAEFVSQIKSKLGTRKFDREKGCWTINTEDLDIVKEIVSDVYGYTEGEDLDTVKVKIKFEKSCCTLKDAVRIGGTTIARAWSRDSGAKLGDGVVLVDGKVGSSGSRANWETSVSEGSIFLVTMPRKAVEKAMKDEGIEDNYGFVPLTIEIVNEVKPNKEELEAEKERLLARIAEINKMLEEI